jgi:TatD DNase family protein
LRLFDSHAHYNDEAYNGDLEEVLNKCKNAGIEYITNIGYSKETSEQAIKLATNHENMYATVGCHPDVCNVETDISYVRELAMQDKVVAIGEIGLDYHYEEVNKEIQKKYFIKQIDIANELGLPVCIHSRDADMDMLDILKTHKINKNFVMHCFSSSIEIAKELIKLGAYISFAGAVTFKNAKGLLDVVKIVPLDKLLIETDCPYLAPDPYRGSRNDSSLMIFTAQKIADLREINIEEVANITFENAKTFYNITEMLQTY